ncbi:MAG: hypothetical protein M1826_002304 [Phylliscum demangeonii]|nr:MAG: hypothetical protein M1826_002304 [Phylliscum demangeonii]
MSSMFSSCFGYDDSPNRDTDPLLPQYEDDTSLQRRLHQKLHSYLMLRALSKGYMPSTDQVIINLRTLLASDVLNPRNPALSDSGRRLVKYAKQWLTDFIELLRHKNDRDQIQDFLWYLSQARVEVDTDDLVRTASSIRARADASAAYESFRTIGSLFLTNADFRLFLGDLNVVARQVFADTAFTFAKVTRDAAKTIEPSEQDKEALKHPDAPQGPAPSQEELGKDVAEVGKLIVNGLARTEEEAARSLVANVSGDQRETLLARLKDAVVNLRRRTDYSDSVSTVATLLQRYAQIYSRAVDAAIGTVQEDVGTNAELDRAVKNFWSLVSSFGDGQAWEELEKRFNDVMQHSNRDPQFETLVADIGNFVQKLLTDPDTIDVANEKVEELRRKWQDAGGESSLRHDVGALLDQIHTTFESVRQDPDVSKMISTSAKMINLLSPVGAIGNEELFDDLLHVFVPLLIRGVQYIPIPRLEVSAPELDLLLENLILEPGKTINDSSFLPFRLRVETYNDLEIRKARHRTATRVSSFFTIKADGMSIRADEVGFWLRAHSGLLRLADQGIASFQLDERGMDVHVDVEVGKEKLEKILTLRGVRVHIHHLSYTLRKSKFTFLAWLFKPILRPILRKVMEHQLAKAIGDALHAANRELLFARERLRATRIADPNDLRTFFKAIVTRLTPDPDPDVSTTVGVRAPKTGVFAGVYAPGSVVKLWEDEAAHAGEVVDDQAVREGGWRNEVFDVQATTVG